jgi:hypothetical protein
MTGAGAARRVFVPGLQFRLAAAAPRPSAVDGAAGVGRERFSGASGGSLPEHELRYRLGWSSLRGSPAGPPLKATRRHRALALEQKGAAAITRRQPESCRIRFDWSAGHASGESAYCGILSVRRAAGSA